MSCPPARKGRQRQRYEDHFRLVAGCIPYKFDKEAHQNSYSYDSGKRLRVLMIATPNRNDLVFPKGGWEDDEEIKDAACREALEEAGVKGILSDKPLGVWEFRSKSREKNGCNAGVGGCRGHMYAMKVTQELDSWPEQAIYIRKWLTVDEAFEVCRYDWMRDALRRLVIDLSKAYREVEEETKESIELHKPLLFSRSNNHKNLFLSPCFGNSLGVPCHDKKTYSRNCPFGIKTHFLGFSGFLFKCGHLFTKLRSLPYLERKAGIHKIKPNGPYK